MNHFPAENAAFLSFFQLGPSTQNPSRFWEAIARVHGFILIAAQQVKNPVFEEQFLEEDQFSKAYQAILLPARENGGEKTSAQLVGEFLAATLGTRYQFLVDSSQHVHFSHQNKAYDLFPFFMVKGGTPCWLSKCRPGYFSYTDSAANAFVIDIQHPSFEEVLNGLLEKGWYRAVLKALEGVSDHRKSFENREYSALCFLACDHYKSKRYREAILEFEKAMKIKSNMPQLYYNLALSHARVRSYRTGIHLLNQLNRIRPNQWKT